MLVLLSLLLGDIFADDELAGCAGTELLEGEAAAGSWSYAGAVRRTGS